jgi:homoserine dehydrogenase
MNGTTNFMLSAMESRGVDYADILSEAQSKGFAEGA